MKKCYKCQQIKNLTEFSKDSQNKDFHTNKCKICYDIYYKEYYQKNREKKLEHVKKYLDNNKDKLKTKRLNWSKNWYAKNKQRKSSRNKLWRQNNSEKIKANYHRRMKMDINWRLRRNLRCRLYAALFGNYKKGTAIKILGCS